jgi:putative membrane protein insertion efficiency factor
MIKVPAAARHANGLLLHRDASHAIIRLVCRKCQQIWFPNRNRTSDAEDHPDAMPHSPRCLHCAGHIQMLPRNAGRGLIWLYRHTLSPLVGYNCRHLPTCSVYGDEAIARFGLWAGGWMTLARLLRCQPWGTSGIDNVPAARPPGAIWYLPWRFGRWRGVNDSGS